MNNISDEIKQGESKILEFKEKLPNGLGIAKSIIAFSNIAGGKLIIGVDDKGNSVGVQDDIFELQDKISSIISDNCYPNIIPNIYTQNIEGKIILVIEVFRGNLLPYYLKAQGRTEGVYIRIGATNRKASIENVIELERQRSNITFDEEINLNHKINDLDLKELEIEFEKLGKSLNDKKLLSLKLAKEANKQLYATNGLLILLGLLENVTCKCSRFKGKNMAVFLDKKEYEGNLFKQIERAEKFIKNYISLNVEIKGLQRKETYEIPEVAIREAIVNAYVHRDYSNFGRDIKVGVYDDRIEIVSPGGFPNGITADEIFSGRSEVRNRVLARVLKELGYIEQWGSGINRIKAVCREIGLKDIVIEEIGDFVGVRLFRRVGNELLSNQTATESRPNPDRIPTESRPNPVQMITETDQIILEYLYEKPKITKQELMELLKIKDTKAKEILKKMVEEGQILRVGQGKNTHYIENKK